MKARLALLVAPWIFALAGADTPDIPDAVHWSAAVKSAVAITRGSTATIDLSGEVQEGWHVYALEQHSGGPTPLRITLDANTIVTAAGPTSGTAAEKVQDTHFGFETQLYTHRFIVHLPVRVDRDLAAGKQLIPVSVRFQACSDRECLLPRTVHLSIPIDVTTAATRN
ncbi:MAG TPA: protein-disulfide reductase DsbD domain-containing protein [Steroidobacteraceae bacterium]|nr:protein-disulfide reductase DsbD domain-containing protein [Steroidobacteraceae bacterium]